MYECTAIRLYDNKYYIVFYFCLLQPKWGTGLVRAKNVKINDGDDKQNNQCLKCIAILNCPNRRPRLHQALMFWNPNVGSGNKTLEIGFSGTVDLQPARIRKDSERTRTSQWSRWADWRTLRNSTAFRMHLSSPETRCNWFWSRTRRGRARRNVRFG